MRQAMLIQRGLLAVGAIVLLVLIAWTVVSWYPSSSFAGAQRLAAARERWSTRPFQSYRLRVQQDSFELLPMNISGTYLVHDEALDMRHEGVHQRSVSTVFAWIDRYPQRVSFACNEFNVSVCTRAISYHVTATYDPVLGYPQRLELVQTREPDWLSIHFWRWLWESGHWRTCDNLLCVTSKRSIIDIDLIPVVPGETPVSGREEQRE